MTARHKQRSSDIQTPSLAPSSNVISLVRDLIDLSEPYGDGDEDMRLQLLSKARTLCMTLEKPSETMTRQCWAEVRTPTQ